jgi:NTP pyrophosphatase (non-canonical NTP hydrolase)
MTTRLDDLCRKALLRWGCDAQERMLMEECAELIVALNKFWRADGISCLSDLAEEMADVELMIHQIKLARGLDTYVERWKETKLERLEKLLKEAPNDNR